MVYITAEQLVATGVDPNSDPPSYRVWANKKGRIMIQLYKEP